LDIAFSLLERGKRVLFLKESLDRKWDYTEGQAIDKLNRLLQQPQVKVFSSVSELLSYLKNITKNNFG